MKKNILIIFIIFYPILIFCQEAKLSDVIINIAEDLSADDSDPEAASTYIERLYELTENPVMLNSSGEAEISRLFFLSDFQVKALAGYVHSSGRIFSIYEIANIPGFDNETASMLIPFVSLISKEKVLSDTVRWRNNAITNLSFKTGNDDTSYPGSSWKILTKYKFISGSFSGGFTLEKDQGETFFPVPDFLSANIAYNGNGMVRKIIAGDFSARFGQGTNINTGIRTSLSLTAPGYMSASDEIKPYTSTDENNFFRGIAGMFSIRNLDLVMFLSEKSF